MELFKKNFSIGEAVGWGWETTKKNLGLMIGLALLSFVINGLSEIVPDNAGFTGLKTLVSIGAWVLNIFITIGIVKISLKLYDKKKPEFSEVFNYGRYFLNYLVTSILYGLIVIGGLILLIVPGIIWAIKYQFATYYIIDKDAAIMDSFKKSAEMTQGKKWQLFVFGLALFGVILLGAIAFGVGLLLAIPVVWLSVVYVYRKLL